VRDSQAKHQSGQMLAKRMRNIDLHSQSENFLWLCEHFPVEKGRELFMKLQEIIEVVNCKIECKSENEVQDISLVDQKYSNNRRDLWEI
jgi:hypothetical protein